MFETQRFNLSRAASVTALAVTFFTLCAESRAQEKIVLDQPAVMGMSMFRAHWDTPIPLDENGPTQIKDKVVTDRGGAAVWGGDQPGPIAFDALNRSLLVRFPGAAEKIAAALREGKTVQKVELVLPFKDEELWPVGQQDYVGPDGYNYRTNWDVDKIWRAQRPTWHAVAWALRRPWTADAQNGPTFNASVNGKVYWTKFGAGDEKTDRFPTRFGPAEVSYKQSEPMDVTKVLTDPTFGATLAQRLRTLTDDGFIVQKEEPYDIKYFNGVYEWATGTGPRAILINKPSLIVTLAPGQSTLGGALPPAADAAALPASGKPTATLPSATQLEQFRKAAEQKPAWMPDWQWTRVQELRALDKPERAGLPFWFDFVPPHILDRLSKYKWENGVKVYTQQPDPAAAYAAWVDGIIGRPVRGWSGFETAREMAQWHNYGSTLPAPAQDAIKRYWTAWLMPDRDTAPTVKQRHDFNDTSGLLVHPMADDPRVGGPNAKWPDPANGRFDTYYALTGDWRGNKSFFRSGFTREQSTQNFNTTASSGALLAGTMIGSDKAMEDGRYGMEMMPLRMYAWSSGFSQEYIDHYYFPITVAGNKAVADYTETPFDRLLGQSLLTKNITEVLTAYHPGLRTFVAGSSRSALEFRLGMQDGLQHIVHTLSKSGAERDLGVDKFATGHARIGHDVAPEQVARQTLLQPWAPEWMVPLVDDKVLPSEAVGTGWGGIKRQYLAANYGMFSAEEQESRFQAGADWRREARQADKTSDLATLDVRFTTDKALWMNNGQGHLSRAGSTSVFQNKNKMIVLTSPKGAPNAKRFGSSVGIFTLSENPGWEIFVDGKKVDGLPFTAKQGQKITIHDGVAYLGIIPLPATNLGRDAEVTIEVGEPQKGDLDFYKSRIAASLEVNSFNYKSDAPIAGEAKNAASKAYGGFTIEMGDVAQYGSFEKFQQHMDAARADVSFDANTNIVSAKYSSGNAVLEASSRTVKEDGGEANANFVSRNVNGVSAALPEGLELDTPYVQQGFGKVSKNGATLEGDAKQRVFLLTEPKGGVFCAWNPLPDLNSFSLSLPGGGTVAADGKVGLCRVVFDQKANTLKIDHAFKADQAKQDGAAKALLLSGFAKPPAVTLNGQAAKPSTRVAGGKTTLAISLE
jgi:hypothetical protein